MADPKAPTAPIGIVKGGTTSSSFDKEVHLLREDQLRRQREQDEEVRLVREDGAQRHAMDLGSPNTHPVAVFQYLMPDGRRHQFIQGDIAITTDSASDKPVATLVLVCPRCVERNIPQSQSQIKLDSRNKKWFLDERMKGQVWIDPDNGSAHLLAGTVECAELCKCPQVGCDFKFRISPKSDQPGVGRIVREF